VTVKERSASFRTSRDLLADPTRRRIVELLRERPRRAGELAAEFSVSVPAVSRHLRRLREAGIVADARVAGDGRIRIYSLVGAPPTPHELRRGRIGFRPAATGEPAPPLTAPIEALAVVAGPHRLAFDASAILRIVPYERPATVPFAPFGVEGVIDTGEAIVPVVDLRVRLGIPPGDPDARTRLVLLDADGSRVALRVDATAEAAAVTPDTVTPTPELALGDSAGFVLGVVRMPGGLAVLIDPAELLES
jgi:chemotaxis signal transduction protein